MMDRDHWAVVGLLFSTLALLGAFYWVWKGGFLHGLDDQSTNLHPEPPPSPKELNHGG